jgi:hypothetical protein
MSILSGKSYRIGLTLCFAAGVSAVTNGQRVVPEPPKPPAKIAVEDRRAKPEAAATPLGFPRMERVTTEKSIAVDPGVNVKFCVSDGQVKINGWDRDEIRVFVKDGRKIGVKVLERNATTDKANWVWLMNGTAVEQGRGPLSNCLAGDAVEIDLPTGATVNMEARTTGASIDTVKSVSVKIIEGSISIRNVKGGVKAEAYQGDVMLESSNGQITLQTTTGNIVAFDVNPGEIGDLLRAKTSSGAISLQRVSHRQIEANSISGSVNFDGSFLTGGIYNFKTSNGSIRLQLPEKSSCMVSASFGFGTFNYGGMPFEVLTESLLPGGKNIVGKIGDGDANVSVTTSNGSIVIKKQ